MAIGGTVAVTGGLTAPVGRAIGGNVAVSGELLSKASGTRRRTVVVGQQGTVVDSGWLAEAAHGDVTWEPSQEDRWKITVPVSAKASALLGPSPTTDDYGVQVPFREVILYRGTRVLSWGPILDVRQRGDLLEVEGAGAGWYLNRRVGPGNRPNLLDFEPTRPLDGWWRFCTGAGFTFGPMTASSKVEQSLAAGAGWSSATMRFTSTLAADPTDDYTDPVALRLVRINAAAFTHTVTFTAWRWFEDWDRPNLRKSGLGLAILPVDWTDFYFDVRWAAYEPLSEQRSASPERARVSIEVPASGVDLVVACIVTAPRGVTHYWGFDLDWDGGIEFGDGEDQADIAWKVADHVTGNTESAYAYATQHPLMPYAGGSIGKSDVNIRPDTARTGVERTRRFLFPSNTTGKNALADLANLDDGLEWSIGYDVHQGRRWFRTHHPKMGRYRANCPIRRTPAGSTVSDVAWSFEGSQAASSVHVIAAGDPRAMGNAVDSSDFSDGLTVEQVATAPADVAADRLTLNPFAEARLDRVRRPAVVTCKLPAAPYWTDRGLSVGDRVPVRIVHGDLDVDGVMRVSRLTLSADDVVSLTLVPWPGGAT